MSGDNQNNDQQNNAPSTDLKSGEDSAAENVDPFEGFESGSFVNGQQVEEKSDDADDEKKDEASAGAADEENEEDGASDDESGDDDGDEDASHDGDEDDDGEDKKKGNEREKIPAKKRINQITKEKHEALRRAEAAEQKNREFEVRLAALENPQKKDAGDAGDDVKNETEKKPDPKDFEFGVLDEGYVEALSDWKVEQRLKDFEARQDEKRQSEAADAATQEFREKAEEVRSRGNEKYEDFEEKVIVGANEGIWPLSAELAQQITDSDVGEDIAYHLATNVAEAQRIADLPAIKQGAEFARLEARFTTTDTGSAEDKQPEKSEVRPSKAPTPPKQKVRGKGGKFGTSPDTDDFEAFEKAFNSGEFR